MRTYEVTYKNDTKEYQLVGGLRDVICSGTEEFCIAEMKKIDIENSPWGVVEVIEPGGRRESTFCRLENVKGDDDSWIAELEELRDR